eukprot:1536017-Rhodomonas_salina.2
MRILAFPTVPRLASCECSIPLCLVAATPMSEPSVSDLDGRTREGTLPDQHVAQTLPRTYLHFRELLTPGPVDGPSLSSGAYRHTTPHVRPPSEYRHATSGSRCLNTYTHDHDHNHRHHHPHAAPSVAAWTRF